MASLTRWIIIRVSSRCLVSNEELTNPSGNTGAWVNSLHDTDVALSNLFRACVRAGPTICPIYKDNASLIASRVDGLLERIKNGPIAFFNASTEEYGLVDYSVVKFAILQCLVRLHQRGQALVRALADLEKGNAEPIWHLSGRAIGWKDYFSRDATLGPPAEFAGGMELGSAVACAEADRVADDLESLKTYYTKLATTSSFAYEWTRRVSCSYVVVSTFCVRLFYATPAVGRCARRNDIQVCTSY